MTIFFTIKVQENKCLTAVVLINTSIYRIYPCIMRTRTVLLKRNASEIHEDLMKMPYLRRNCGASCFWREYGVPFVL